jgi:type III pantothenate kinase
VNLCIDIGNTALKFGIFEGNTLQQQGTSYEALKDAVVSHVKVAIVSTVVSEHPVMNWLSDKAIPFLILSNSFTLPFSNVYTTPETLGADRIAAVAGAKKRFPNQNSLVITAGSCITYNIINAKGVFLGGAISPGVRMRFEALQHFTAKLPLVNMDPKADVQWIGNDTKTSIETGVYRAVLNEIEGFIRQFEADFENLNILICGGDAPFLVSHLKNNIFATPSLILEGLNYILQLNANKLS